MKRFILSLTLATMGVIAFMPIAQAASKKSPMADQNAMASNLNQRVQHNRDLRNSK